jgi:hypothetical protein
MMTKVIAHTAAETQVRKTLQTLRNKQTKWVEQQSIANDMLYVLLEECLDFYRFLQSDERYAVAFKNICDVKYNAKTKLANMVAKSVFGETKQTYAYAKVLMKGFNENIGTEGNLSMRDWLLGSNGINGVIRDGNTDSKAQQEHYIEIASNYRKFLKTTQLGKVSGNNLTNHFDDGDVLVLLGRKESDGSITLQTSGCKNANIQRMLMIEYGKLIANTEEYRQNCVSAQEEIDAEKQNAEKAVSEYAEAMNKRIEDAESSLDKVA